MFLHLSDCHIATEVNAKPVCAFPETAPWNTALITHPLTVLNARFESGRENPNQLNATERTLMSRERILRRSRCSAIFSPHGMSESRAADGRAGRVLYKTARSLSSSIHTLHPCHVMVPILGSFYRMIS